MTIKGSIGADTGKCFSGGNQWKLRLGGAAGSGAHLGAPWGRAAGHRSACPLASPAGHSPGQCPSLGSTSHPASSHRCHRFLCTGEKRKELRQGPRTVRTCAKPETAKRVCSLEMSRQGAELFPWLKAMSQFSTTGPSLHLCCLQQLLPGDTQMCSHLLAL